MTFFKSISGQLVRLQLEETDAYLLDTVSSTVIMDTVIISLLPKVGAILMENIEIIEIVSMFLIGAYNALENRDHHV